LHLTRLYTQIALARRGPEDVPAMPWVLVATALAYLLLNLLLSTLLPATPDGTLPVIVFDTVLLLGSYFVVLKVAGRPARWRQTVSAVLGVQVVLLPAIALATSLFAQYKDNAEWQLPAALPLMVVGLWLLFVNARILSAATTWNLWPCLGLVFAQGLLSRIIEMSLLPGVAAAS
jgi:hypothetical protein